MTVVFKTQQGRILRNDELDAEDVTRALGQLVEIIGYDLGYPECEFHVSTRHVVEWWDAREDAGSLVHVSLAKR